jgi:TPR repeat protein
MKKKLPKHAVRPVSNVTSQPGKEAEKSPSVSECRQLLNRGHYTKAFSLLQPLAEGGNGEAAYLLSLLYDRGDGTPTDHQLAASWLKTSAELNYPDAEFKYAMTIAPFANNKEFDYEICARYLDKAVVHNHPKAMLELGKLYFTGRGVENNREKAIEMIRMAEEIDPSICSDEHIGSCLYANVELAEAYPYLVRAYNKGFYSICGILSTYYMRGAAGIEQNVELAFGILKKGAENRNGLSEYIIGSHYRDEFNYRKAAIFFDEAYRHGILEAGYDLANILMKSFSPTRADTKKVFSLLRNVATYPTIRHSDAMADLGTCYHEGWGTNKNYEEAVKYYRRSLKSNPENTVAKLGLGFCILNGHGVRQNTADGLKHIKSVAEKGIIPACSLLYRSFKDEDSSRQYVKNFDEYIYWLTKSAENNDDEACFILGNIYLDGRETEQNIELAEKYLGRAAYLLHFKAVMQVMKEEESHEDPDPVFTGTYALILKKFFGIGEYSKYIPKDAEALEEINENMKEMLFERIRADLGIPTDKAADFLRELSHSSDFDQLDDIPVPSRIDCAC